MNKLMLAGLTCASLLAPNVLAHGGQYRGPGDVVPPSTGGGGRRPTTPGPTTPGPSAPGAPAPAGPTTPGPGAPPPPGTGGPGAPPPGGAPRTGPRGIQLTVDLTKWQFWWELNKDPIINLRDAIHAPATKTGSDQFYMGSSKRKDSKDTAAPSESDIQETILPTIKRALENSEQRDINSSCMIALGKIGRNGNDFKILPIFEAQLKKSDQEIRETAAISMGISAMPEAVDPLIQLATDSDEGRKLCGRPEVDARTRSFACYGMALVAYANADVDLKTKVFTALNKILHDEEKSKDRNIQVAAINGLSLLKLNVEANASDKEKKLLADTLASLDKFYAKKAGRGTDLIKSHVPTAVAKLIGRGNTDLHKKYKKAYHKDLTARSGKKKAADIFRGCALALGRLALPQETEKADKVYSSALLKHFQNGKDAQARYFSLIALGQIGGDANKNALLKILRRGNKALERPWSAIALGVLNFEKMQADTRATADTTVGALLLKQIKEVKNPESRAAFAVALGMSKYQEAASEMMNMLQKYRNQNELAGYLCIGLALMDYGKAVPDIHQVVRDAVRRPELLRQAAVALGKLGDKTVTNTLTKMLQEKETNLAKLSAIASALGFIGDRRTIQPLKKMLHNDELTALSRAFAAVALGGVADKEKLPWNSKISRDLNYRAAVETLTQSGTGVLDIL